MIPRLSTRLKLSLLEERPSDSISDEFYRQNIIVTISESSASDFSLSYFLSNEFPVDYAYKVREVFMSAMVLVNSMKATERDPGNVAYNIITKSVSAQDARKKIIEYLSHIDESVFSQLQEKFMFLKEAKSKKDEAMASRLLRAPYEATVPVKNFRVCESNCFQDIIFHDLCRSRNDADLVFKDDTVQSDSPDDWFIRLCKKFTSENKNTLPFDILGEEIIKMVVSISNADDIQARLFDLVGENGFDFMTDIIQNISKIKHLTLSGLHESINLSKNSKSNVSERTNRQRREDMPEAQPLSQGDLLTALGFTGEYLAQERSLGLHGGRPHVETNEIKATLAAFGSGLEYHEKRGLPEGTTRKSAQGYEEIHMPAPKRPDAKNSDELIAIDTLESWAQLAFPDTKSLNRIQSAVFDTAYNSSENMLICAPTGAGKTNIAMLTFLQLVKQNIHDGVLDKQAIKVIYIAPMKALAQEVVAKFSERLAPLGLVVKEYTGDMQLTKAEVAESQLLVSTPEKYDVITRKGGDGSLGTLVSLIIIDEVHLLADDRGSVIEIIVARTQRYVESSQKMIRLVGLSATLPNYKDVAMFLGVNQRTGLYYFGPEYRPVPLEQTFIGVTEKNKLKRNEVMNKITYEKLVHALERDKQVMIFVHSRKDTSKTAMALIELAQRSGGLSLLENIHHEKYGLFKRDVDKSRSKEVQQLFYSGFGVHHAGMLRSDRSLTEMMFEQGVIRVLCCTATLAWGVNLPAHTVIIKGTEIYDPERGGFVDLSILDVFQIFGRAGRPQYDNSGHALLITPHQSLGKYLSLLGEQAPIESNFTKALADHMNAEIVNGTINNIKEAVQWLSYTFLYIRMCKNPMVYGISLEERMDDARLEAKRLALVKGAAQKLDMCRMIRYDQRSGNLAVTDLGRIASHYYIKHDTIESFNNHLQAHLDESSALAVLCGSSEFNQLKVRPEEIPEIDSLKSFIPVAVKGSSDGTAEKVNILLQSYLQNKSISSFTLQSDTNYVATNAGRISRALFEISLKRGWSTLTYHYLTLSKAIDRHVSADQHPLRQFASELNNDVLRRLEEADATIDILLDMNTKEIGELVHNQKFGGKILSFAKRIPKLEVQSTIQPLTRGILRISMQITVLFEWSERWHGVSENFWIWVEDSENEYIYHSELLTVTKKQKDEVLEMEFVIPVREPLPPQYFIRIVSDRWLGSQYVVPLSFQHLLMPDKMPPHTNLLDIHPVPKSALKEPQFESLYPFSHFNPVQSQVFHALYYTDVNALIGAPTGSGKTIIGEFALLRLFKQRPGAKAIYVAPLKALSRERLLDWQRKLGSQGLGYKVEELTGDVTPDLDALRRADLLIVTPEKWDSISRGWQKREYVKLVELVIIDEIHLLGVDRGPVLEVIVSRMRFISSQTKHPIRFVGLSTALANPRDLADWLGIEDIGVYNFRPSVRPIPMTIHIMGFPGKAYCPRMATMNKPCYAAILEHSPKKPVLIFVSSRRQTRLTALDLISYSAADDNPKLFLNMPEYEIDAIADTLKDSALGDTITFGVGIHHAGLNNHDRTTVETLFAQSKIQVLVCTSTLAWGVNLPCHLVIVKGTEFYDGKTHRYVDMPVTDVLQMMGRAGRPQFDDTGVSCVFVHEPKKNFYRKFLHEPFPVESSLHKQLHEHINAEIANGTLLTVSNCIEYLSWTYLFRRLIMNPSYYQLNDTTPEGLATYLHQLIKTILLDLAYGKCIDISLNSEKAQDENLTYEAMLERSNSVILSSTTLGKIAAFYYLDYRSSLMFNKEFNALSRTFSLSELKSDRDYIDHISKVAIILCQAKEFSELPVRHNEEILNARLAMTSPWQVDENTYEEPSTKAYLLLQCHIYQTPLPITDYINDTKSVLDQFPRVLNAMIDIAADMGYLHIVSLLVKLSQMVTQGLEYSTNMSTLRQICQIDKSVDINSISNVRLSRKGPKNQSSNDNIATNQHGISSLVDLVSANYSTSQLVSFLENYDILSKSVIEDAVKRIIDLPLFKLSYNISSKSTDESGSEECTMDVNIERIHGNRMSKLYAPRYPKAKSISHWLILGYNDELVALKRIGEIYDRATISLSFDREDIDVNVKILKLFLWNDSLMTFDTEVAIQLTS